MMLLRLVNGVDGHDCGEGVDTLVSAFKLSALLHIGNFAMRSGSHALSLQGFVSLLRGKRGCRQPGVQTDLAWKGNRATESRKDS